MDTQEQAEIRRRLDELQIEHRDLDDAIALLLEQPYVDQFKITRMKKRKLQLKDAIDRYQSKLIPDLNA